MEKQPTFEKMKVTGPRCAEFITQPMDVIRELNPSLNTMIQSTEGMRKVLCEAAKQPSAKRRKIASSAVAVHDAHLQRLKAFKTGSDHMYDPMLEALAQQPPIRHVAPAAPPAPVEEIDESSLATQAHMQRVMSAIPKQYRGKATMLGSYLKAHPELIRVTSTGRPVVFGTGLRNANILDVMRSLYVWPRSQELPPGTKEVVEALYTAGVPSYLLSNTAVRTMYQTLPEVSEQPHMETSEEEAEGAEEEQEMSTLYETPVHSTITPQAIIQKAEERVPTKPSPSMLPRPVHTAAVSVPVAHPVSKASGIPAMSVKHEAVKTSGSSVPKTAVTKHESGKPSSSQTGHGSDGITEYICDDPRFPGKPLRILRLY
jgi:hypothetical protein